MARQGDALGVEGQAQSLQAGAMPDARTLAARARLTLSTNRQVFSASEYESLDRQANALLDDISRAEIAAREAAAIQAGKEQLATAQRQETIQRSDLSFAEVDGEVDSLVRAVELIAQRAQRIYDYLATQDLNAIDGRLAQLQGSADPSAQAIVKAFADMVELLKVDPAEWVEAIAGQEELMQMFGDRMPQALRAEHEDLANRINAAITPADLVGREGGE